MLEVTNAPELVPFHFRHVSPAHFKDVMTKGTKGEPWGKTAYGYAAEIIARSFTDWEDDTRAPALDFGNIHEADAVRAYELLTFRKVHGNGPEQVKIEIPGLEWPGIGGYTDGYVGEDGMIEVKSRFSPAAHIQTCISGKVPDDNIDQIQGYLMITGRKWCDYVSYCPFFEDETRIKVIRVFPDEAYIAALRARIDEFRVMVRKMARKYYFPSSEENTNAA